MANNAQNAIDDLKTAILKAQDELQAAYDSLVAGDYDKALVRVNRVATGVVPALAAINTLKEKKAIKAANPTAPVP